VALVVCGGNRSSLIGYGMRSGSAKREDDQPFRISLQVTWNLAVRLALRHEINSSARKRFDCGIANKRVSRHLNLPPDQKLVGRGIGNASGVP